MWVIIAYIGGVAGAFVIGTYAGSWAMARKANRYIASRLGDKINIRHAP